MTKGPLQLVGSKGQLRLCYAERADSEDYDYIAIQETTVNRKDDQPGKQQQQQTVQEEACNNDNSTISSSSSSSTGKQVEQPMEQSDLNTSNTTTTASDEKNTTTEEYDIVTIESGEDADDEDDAAFCNDADEVLVRNGYAPQYGGGLTSGAGEPTPSTSSASTSSAPDLSRSGIDLRNGGDIQSIIALQEHLSDYTITVFEDFTGKNVWFEGPLSTNENPRRNIDLIFDAQSNHFNTITSVTCCFGANFYCRPCRKTYTSRNNHKCSRPCRACYIFPPCTTSTRTSFKKVILCAHNLRAFDGMFLLQHMSKELKIAPDVILNGSKILTISFDDKKFIDTLNFLPMALRKIPSVFGFENEVVKGYFPYLFIRPENYDYTGDYPHPNDYGVNEMSPKEKETFMQWYGTETVGKVFDFKRDIVEYCRADVSVLRRGVTAYCQLCREIAKVDPLRETITLASVCLLAFRRSFLTPDTLGLIPHGGYRLRDKQSHSALMWLKYIEHDTQTRIEHSGNGREKYVYDKKVDGYSVDAEGRETVYFFHGCL
ncbi:hypothetical protein B566_EDAN017876 [Ephemera danica]|nr:hypothetical protein B566_EDAN017876 [Ephemera danica]